MTIFALKGSLEEITPAQLSEQTCSAVFITDSAHAEETLNGEHNLRGRDIPA